MGRLIDADALDKSLEKEQEDLDLDDELSNAFGDGLIWASEVLSKEPTVEAIPKADYENRLKVDTMAILDKIEAEIANHLQIMDICDVEKVNGVIVQSELTNRKVVLYDSVMRIIDKYKAETEQEDGTN
jgi:hypothetical protein